MAEQRFVVATQVLSPLEVGPELVEPGDGISVGDSRKWRGDPFEGRQIPLQFFELFAAFVECPRDEVADEVLLEPHILRGVGEGHLGLDHPKLGQVPPGLGLLRPECRPEAVDFT